MKEQTTLRTRDSDDRHVRPGLRQHILGDGEPMRWQGIWDMFMLKSTRTRPSGGLYVL